MFLYQTAQKANSSCSVQREPLVTKTFFPSRDGAPIRASIDAHESAPTRIVYVIQIVTGLAICLFSTTIMTRLRSHCVRARCTSCGAVCVRLGAKAIYRSSPGTLLQGSLGLLVEQGMCPFAKRMFHAPNERSIHYSKLHSQGRVFWLYWRKTPHTAREFLDR